MGVISTDVHRIGGLATLRAFCEILGLPLRRAATRDQLRAALEAFSTRDLVLVDTPGVSPRDDAGLAYLAELLGGASGVRAHLVSAATTSADDVRALVRRLPVGRPASVLVTKLDEARGPGAALSASVGAGRPISHLCAGQEVPDDVEAADPNTLAERILARAA